MLGLPLLARTLFTLEEAGMTDAYVVVGCEAAAVRRTIERMGRFRIRLHWLTDDEWARRDGLSVLVAQSVFTEPFIVVRADQVFDSAIVQALRRKADGVAGGVDLAVATDLHQVGSPEHAIKVLVAEGRIVELGPSLPKYNAVLTGTFLASPALFDAVREVSGGARATLAHSFQRLATRGLVRATPVDGLMWQEVATPRSLPAAERKLLAAACKSSDGPVAKYLNRPISTAISRRLVKLGARPGHLTLAHLIMGLIAGAVVTLGGYVPYLVGGVMFHVTSVLDGSDGEIAKLTFRCSRWGEWFDTVADNITYLAFFGGLTIGVVRSPVTGLHGTAGLSGLVLALAAFVSMYLYLAARRESGSFLNVRYGYESGRGRFSRMLRVGQYLMKRDVFAVVILLLAVAGQLPVALVLFFVAAAILFVASVKLNAGLLLEAVRPNVPSIESDGGWFDERRPDVLPESANR